MKRFQARQRDRPRIEQAYHRYDAAPTARVEKVNLEEPKSEEEAEDTTEQEDECEAEEEEEEEEEEEFETDPEEYEAVGASEPSTTIPVRVVNEWIQTACSIKTLIKVGAMGPNGSAPWKGKNRQRRFIEEMKHYASQVDS